MYQRQTRPLGRLLILMLVGYFVYKFIGVLVSTRSRQQTDVTFDSAHAWHGEAIRDTRRHDASIDGRIDNKGDETNNGGHIVGNGSIGQTSNCQTVVQLAVVVLDPAGCRQFSQLLTTVLHGRRHSLHVYVLGNPVTHHIINTLLETWTLPHVWWTLIDVEQLAPPETNTEAYLIASIPFLLPTTVNQVMYLSGRVRLVAGVDQLWDQFTYFTSDHTYGTLPQLSASRVHQQGVVDVLLLRVSQIRRLVFPRGASKVREMHRIASHTRELLSSLLGNYPYLLSCGWGVGLGEMDKLCHSTSVQALIWEPHEDRFSGNDVIELAKEQTLSILASDSEVYRHQSLDCHTNHKHIIDLNPASKCLEYRYAAALKKRTHLYYIAHPEAYRETDNQGNDVVLLTQFTLDRLATFERFMSNWEGPVVAVLYVNDLEALTLPQTVATSDVLRHRKNIAYHLVYKRGVRL